MEITKSKSVILVDADYVDGVAFNLTVNFERMLERRIPKADLARWLVCVALDGRMPEGDNEVQVVFIHDKQSDGMRNFMPGKFDGEIHGQAFRDDRMGEFVLSAYAVEDMVGKDDFFADALQTLCAQQGVQRVAVVPNAEDAAIYNKVEKVLRQVDDEMVRVTLLTMQPTAGCPCWQEQLGYSLMAALGIRSEEIKPK